MIAIAKTKNSLYLFDSKKMSWRRIETTIDSGNVRQENGQLLSWPKFEVGKQLLINDSKLLEGAVAHYVVTSPLLSVVFGEES